MAKVERFEELVAWQKGRRLVRDLYHVTRRGDFARDRDLVSQIRRAAVSVMSNVAEGFERGGRSEFEHFLSTAKSSCGEVRSLLYVAFDAEYIDESTFLRFRANADEVGRIVGGLRAAVERQRQAQQTQRRSR
ncbi:MAG TPA: four helix bundle protein [Thermomicrobiales bacterium]|nr:four helix bundle protein [Thermomicrobiales bacterium]